MEKPVVIAPSHLTENFLEGFEEEQAEQIQMLLKKFGLRALRYKYKNKTEDVKIVSGRFENIIDRIKSEIDARGDNLAAIIKGVPGMWGISLMKYVIQLISTSFPGNVKELEERGWFD